MPLLQLLLDVRLSDGRQEGGNHVLVGGDAVELCSRLDDARPLDEGGHAEAALPGRPLLTVEGDGTAVGPGEGLGAVVGGVEDDGVVVDAEFLDLGKDTADAVVVLEHAVGIEADAALAFPFLAEVGPDMHACGGHPGKEWFAILVGPFDEINRRVGKFVVSGFHALFRHGTGVLDLLAAFAVSPGVEHAPGAALFTELFILRIVIAFRLFLCVEMVEVAEDPIQAMDCRQMFVLVAQMVLAELPTRVAVWLEKRCKSDHPVGYPLVRAGHANGEQTGTEWVLAGNEGCPPGSTALLSVPVSEKCSSLRNGVDIGGLVAHHPLVVSAGIPVANVVAPDDNNVRLVLGRLHRNRQAQCQGYRSYSDQIFPV